MFDGRAAVVDSDGAAAPVAEAKSLPFSDSSDIPYTVMKVGGEGTSACSEGGRMQ